MKRTHVILAGVLACAAGATAAGARPPSPTAHSSRSAVVSLRSTSLGRVLTSGSGRTLYMFTRDRAGRNSCMSIGGCSETWPPLRSSGRPIAGSGIRSSLLSTIRLPGGIGQVTYAGHPLYLYSADSGPGETSYVGARQFGGVWYAMSSSGRTVR